MPSKTGEIEPVSYKMIDIPLDDDQNNKLNPKSNMNGDHVNGLHAKINGKDGVDNLVPNTKIISPKTEEGKVGIFQLYRYAEKFDVFLILIGTIGSMATGAAIPVNLVIYGDVIDAFVDNARGNMRGAMPNVTMPPPVDVVKQVEDLILYFCLIGVVTFVCAYFSIAFWTWSAERQSNVIRKKYFRAIMRQDMTWFDTHETGELNAKLSSDLHVIAECMGDKIAICIQFLSTALGGYIMGLVQYWKLALVALSFSPVVLISTSFVSKKLREMSVQESKLYSKAGSVAEEALRSIRTVQAFQGQEKEAVRYEKHLTVIDKLAAKKGVTFGVASAVFWTIIFIAFAVIFWYGVKLTQDDDIRVGIILPVFFGVLIGSMSLGNALPYLDTINKGRGSASNVFKVIDSIPSIDISSDKGDKPHVEGNVSLVGVHFTYPSRKEVTVLDGVNIDVKKGKVVALVGASGSGKSTVVQLIQRFYDPGEGKVLVDGKDIRTFNLRYLREQIGVVSQEPVLFATSIAENIKYGNLNVTQAQIIEAAKQANAHDFISTLPEGYDTMVGERGAQLSGGQKQRIAIARALIRNPKILLLDEATSALDHESEAIVQDALEKVEAGRTTIVIAHRLSTVKNADEIVVLDNGIVREKGTHDTLMEKEDFYYRLVNSQMHSAEKQKHQKDEDEGSTSESENEDRTSLKSQKSLRRSARKFKTTQSLEENKDKEDGTEVKEESAKLGRILKLNSPELPYLVVGSFTSMLSGLNHPAFAFILTEYMKIFAFEKDEQTRQSILLSLIIAGIGLGMFFIRILQHYTLTIAGSRLTQRFRKLVFRSLLKQDMEFFDDKNNQVGALTTKLSSDTTLVQGATGAKIGNVFESATLLIAALVIAFVYGWKLSLVILAFIPVLVISGVIQGRMATGFNKSDGNNLDKAGMVCAEAVDNIRTVNSLTREDIFLQKYERILDLVKRNGRKRALFYAIFYGFAQSISFFAYAAAFYYGSILVEDGEMEFFEVFRVFSTIVFGGMVLGRGSAYSMDYNKAKVAAARLFNIIDRTPAIDSSAGSGKTLETFDGNVKMKDIFFKYPSRPDAIVMSEMNLEINPGETVALVGHSGCGKSTIVQLVQRFYDPSGGQLETDGVDIRQLNIQWLRSKIGIVSQEPLLFATSIGENIAYGDNSSVVGMDEIIQAARNANIHNFIESLPLGYETNVGDKGTQLSGGQKQRIAIARALVRNPKLLLLDEATSALDTQSEQIVQEALDKARSGRTCIVIAHRLSTIQNADKIVLLRHGKVEESGTHAELMEKKGAYFKLHQAQNRTRKT